MRASISRIEAGSQKEMSAGHFFALAKALKADPQTLWEGLPVAEDPKTLPKPPSRPPRGK